MSEAMQLAIKFNKYRKRFNRVRQLDINRIENEVASWNPELDARTIRNVASEVHMIWDKIHFGDNVL